MNTLNKGTLRVTRKFQVGGRIVDTLNFAPRSAAYLKEYSKGALEGSIGFSRDNDYGKSNEAIVRANLPLRFRGNGPLANAPINWGVRKSEGQGGDYVMFPHAVVKPYSNNTVSNIPIPQDAYNYAKTTHSIMNVGKDLDFANYLAQVGVHASLKTTDPLAWKGVLDRYAKSTNIKQVVPPLTYASTE